MLLFFLKYVNLVLILLCLDVEKHDNQLKSETKSEIDIHF